jgi:hypothetical protein
MITLKKKKELPVDFFEPPLIGCRREEKSNTAVVCSTMPYWQCGEA